jgi:hypothetical protein
LGLFSAHFQALPRYDLAPVRGPGHEGGKSQDSPQGGRFDFWLFQVFMRSYFHGFHLIEETIENGTGLLFVHSVMLIWP